MSDENNQAPSSPKPWMMCPFCDREVEIVPVGPRFMVRSKHGWFSQPFDSAAQAEEWLKYRGGEKIVERVEVAKRTPRKFKGQEHVGAERRGGPPVPKSDPGGLWRGRSGDIPSD